MIPVGLFQFKVPRIFTISPAVSGLTTWDLDLNGPMTVTVNSTFTALSSFPCVVEMNGAGGAGGINSLVTSTDGGNTTFNGLVAGGGKKGTSGPAGSAFTGTGGVGGTSTGGDVNTTGGSGGNGARVSNPGTTGTGGSGGSSPNGGAVQPGTTTSTATNGNPGNAPGGGGSGGATGGVNESNKSGGGGGGGGGYCEKAYSSGALPLTTLSIVIGAGGTASGGGTSTGAKGRFTIT